VLPHTANKQTNKQTKKIRKKNMVLLETKWDVTVTKILNRCPVLPLPATWAGQSDFKISPIEKLSAKENQQELYEENTPLYGF
jgi:hypothetical protein